MYYSAEGLNHLSILERELPDVVGGPVEVLNLGVASYETREQVRSLTTKGLKYAPDFVLVTYCVNDGLSFVDLGNRLGLEGQMGERPADDAIATHTAIRNAVAADENMDWDELFTSMIQPRRQWIASIESFGDLAAMGGEYGFEVLIVLFPAFLELDDYFLAPIHRAVESAGAKLGVTVLDLTPAFAAEGSGVEFRTSETDSIHPNARGYAIAAAEIEQWFSENRPWDNPR
jgi:lysophospholipase L1-like esterase